jgi:hypothetical protein
MPKLKLTKIVVDAAQKEEEPYELRDTVIPGFLLKVTPTGRKIFMLAYVATTGSAANPPSASSARSPSNRPGRSRKTGSRMSARARIRAPKRARPAKRQP